MKKYLLIVLCVWSWPVLAQSYLFQVLAQKGNPTLDGATAKVGSRLVANQTLKVPAGAYLSLAHHSGKVLEVAPGSYQVKDLEAQLPKTTSSSKYAEFVLNELTNPTNNDAVVKNRTKHMKKTGAVVRSFAAPVETMLPMKTKIFGQVLVLRWYNLRDTANAEKHTYKVLVSDLGEGLLYTQTTKEQSLQIDLTKQGLAKYEQLMFKVVPIGPDGKEKAPLQMIDGNAIVRLQPAEVKTVREELEVIVGKGAQANAFAKLIEARYFEERELFADAIFAYEKAMEYSGRAEQYQRIYQFFLDRNGLSRESRAE
jgi:hypothetical protein